MGLAPRQPHQASAVHPQTATSQQDGPRQAKGFFHMQRWDCAPRSWALGDPGPSARSGGLLPIPGGSRTRKGTTREAGRAAIWVHRSWHIWVLLGGHSVTCPKNNHVSSPAATPSGVRPLIPDVSGNPGNPGPTTGLQEPVTKGKIIRG